MFVQSNLQTANRSGQAELKTLSEKEIKEIDHITQSKTIQLLKDKTLNLGKNLKSKVIILKHEIHLHRENPEAKEQKKKDSWVKGVIRIAKRFFSAIDQFFSGETAKIEQKEIEQMSDKKKERAHFITQLAIFALGFLAGALTVGGSKAVLITLATITASVALFNCIHDIFNRILHTINDVYNIVQDAASELEVELA